MCVRWRQHRVTGSARDAIRDFHQRTNQLAAVGLKVDPTKCFVVAIRTLPSGKLVAFDPVIPADDKWNYLRAYDESEVFRFLGMFANGINDETEHEDRMVEKVFCTIQAIQQSRLSATRRLEALTQAVESTIDYSFG